MRRILSKTDQGLNEQVVQYFIELIFQCIVSTVIELAAKQHLVLIFESLLLIYQSVEQKSNGIQTLYEKIFDNIGLII